MMHRNKTISASPLSLNEADRHVPWGGNAPVRTRVFWLLFARIFITSTTSRLPIDLHLKPIQLGQDEYSVHQGQPIVFADKKQGLLLM